jgi:hypothetical protein
MMDTFFDYADEGANLIGLIILAPILLLLFVIGFIFNKLRG